MKYCFEPGKFTLRNYILQLVPTGVKAIDIKETAIKTIA